MKTAVIKRNIIVLIFAAMLLIYGGQGISYSQGGTPTVTPGDTNTSLRVSFIDLLYAFDENAYQIQLRRKIPQGDWITNCVDISYRRKPNPNNIEIYTYFHDLELGVTYEARYRDTNLSECNNNPPSPQPWSAISEGTTLLENPPVAEFVDTTLAVVVRRTLGLDLANGVDMLIIRIAELSKLKTLLAGAASTDDLGLPKITDLTGLEHATQLITLSLASQDMTDLTYLTHFTQLISLDLWANQISDITPLAQLTELTKLSLSGNEISDISPLAELTELRELGLGSNEISDISPLAELTELRELSLSFNRISDIGPLAQLIELTTLTLNANQVSDITPLTQLTKLTLLSLTVNQIRDITSIAQMKQLTLLQLAYNQIRDITPLAQAESLTEVHLDHNQIRDLNPLTTLTRLTTLDLASNQISDVTPLAQLSESLEKLDLRDNRIRDVTPLASLIYLERLSLRDNPITDTFPLSALLDENPNLRIDIEVVREEGGPTFAVSTPQPLTAATLNGSAVTLTLSSGAFGSRIDIRDDLIISGITGITFHWTDIEKVSNTEIKIKLTFDGTIDKNTTLTFTVGPGAIADYNGPALIAEIPVSASTEVEVTGELVVSTAFPLTKATLDGSVVILTLKNNSYIQGSDLTVTIWGIDGVTAEGFGRDVFYISNKEISVQLNFNGDLDTDATLILTVPPSAIENYSGPPLSAALPVTVKTGQQVLVPESQRPSMFWINTDTDKIESLEPFDAVTQEVASLTVDAAGGKIYWAEQGSSRGTIKRANLDGTNVEVLTTEPITASSFVVDTADNKLYWTDSTQGRVHSADLNGENITTIIELDDIKDIAVDTEGGKLYFSDTFAIRRVNRDGTNVEIILTGWGTFRTTGIGGIAVADGKIYWTEQQNRIRGSGKIHRANLNGTNLETLATPLGTLTGIAVDTVGGKVYWANSSGGIQRMDINGGEVENIVYGITSPETLALGPAPTQPTTTDAVVSFSPVSVASPAVGQQLEFSLNITGGEGVTGYQVTVQFDDTVLRFDSGANGDFLPAVAFFVEPVVEGNLVKLNAASRAGETSGDGTLATLTFEVIAVKASTLTLSDVLLTDSDGIGYVPNLENAEITETQLLKRDVNGDGNVNIQDLVLVASNLGKTGQNAADVNEDGIVNIQDLVLVARVLGNTAAAPSLLHPDALEMLTSADVRQWIIQAQHLALTDPDYLNGITVLEQLLAALTPKQTVLLPNYPNPFNPETWMPYHLSNDANVQISIYDTRGELVRWLDLGHQIAGYYADRGKAAYWDGRNNQGESVASGVYFYQLSAGDYSATRKMLVLK